MSLTNFERRAVAALAASLPTGWQLFTMVDTKRPAGNLEAVIQLPDQKFITIEIKDWTLPAKSFLQGADGNPHKKNVLAQLEGQRFTLLAVAGILWLPRAGKAPSLSLKKLHIFHGDAFDLVQFINSFLQPKENHHERI